jgi:hypothetical protein
VGDADLVEKTLKQPRNQPAPVQPDVAANAGRNRLADVEKRVKKA